MGVRLGRSNLIGNVIVLSMTFVGPASKLVSKWIPPAAALYRDKSERDARVMDRRRRRPDCCLASTGQCTTPDVAHRGIPPGRCRAKAVGRSEVCLARTLRSEVEVLFWSPIGGIQHRRQGRGPELTGRSQCGQVWRCGASVRAGLKEAVDASWWRTKVKRRKAFLGGASRPLAAMPDSYCWIRGRSGDAVTTKSQRFTQGDLLGPGRVGR